MPDTTEPSASGNFWDRAFERELQDHISYSAGRGVTIQHKTPAGMSDAWATWHVWHKGYRICECLHINDAARIAYAVARTFCNQP